MTEGHEPGQQECSPPLRSSLHEIPCISYCLLKWKRKYCHKSLIEEFLISEVCDGGRSRKPVAKGGCWEIESSAVKTNQSEIAGSGETIDSQSPPAVMYFQQKKKSITSPNSTTKLGSNFSNILFYLGQLSLKPPH